MIRKKSEIERKNIALIGIIKNNETNQDLEPQSSPQHIAAAPEGSLFIKSAFLFGHCPFGEGAGG